MIQHPQAPSSWEGDRIGQQNAGIHSVGEGGVSIALDFTQLIHLDAENLAEVGIGEAYATLLPELRKYVPEPARVEELIDYDAGRYSVRSGGKEYPIYGPGLTEESGGSWGRATAAFFALVNDQLAGSAYRFYAIYGGNDLGGMFLTPAQAEEARGGLANREYWPYLPTDEPPRYGQYYGRRSWWRFWG